MTSQSHIVLLAKFVVGFLCVGVVLAVLSHFKDQLQPYRLGLLEGLVLAVFVVTGIFWFFKWIADKHFREY
jgi:hypothetical protein